MKEGTKMKEGWKKGKEGRKEPRHRRTPCCRILRKEETEERGGRKEGRKEEKERRKGGRKE
jgi:hypothetical protein